MTQSSSSFSVCVDVTNPGQFFACCGLLELAHRLWPGAEGWFDSDDTLFNVHASMVGSCTLANVIERLTEVGIEGDLTTEERLEFSRLESQKRTLPKNLEERRASLGKRLREGALTVDPPFNLRVAWWQENTDDIPKTFAGRQEVLRISLALFSQIRTAVQSDRPFEYRSLLQAVREEGQQSGEGTKVEPFYFDAQRFVNALDVGFSLDKQARKLRAAAAPLTELLALMGLQRFRPRSVAETKWTFEFFTWQKPLGVAAAAAVVCGAVHVTGTKGYRFRLQFRDAQKRYKAFGFAYRAGGAI